MTMKVPAPFPPRPPLSPGLVVQVGDLEMQVDEPLGEGSFGIVWGALCRGSPAGDGIAVAVKELRCDSSMALERAEREVRILRSLCDDGRRCSAVPAFVASHVEALRASGMSWRVLIAMERIAGSTLLETLESPRLARQLAAGSGATAIAAVLLRQLAPALAWLSAVAVHRDAHSRNILVELRPGAAPRFVLIDFGLAEDAAAWQGGGWQRQGAAGDSRYWPPSAWAMFQLGAQGLVERPWLLAEYKSRLDLHSMGLSALQALVSLLVLPEVAATATVTLSASAHGLTRLSEAWSAYWEHASRHFEQLHTVFQAGGCLDAARAALSRVAVRDAVAEHCCVLRMRAAEARQALVAIGGELAEANGLLDALLLLIGTGGRPSNEEREEPSWHQISSLVSGDAWIVGEAGASPADLSFRPPARPAAGGASASSASAARTALAPIAELGASEAPASAEALVAAAAAQPPSPGSRSSSSGGFWDKQDRDAAPGAVTRSSSGIDPGATGYWDDHADAVGEQEVLWPGCTLARQAIAAAPFDAGAADPGLEDVVDDPLYWNPKLFRMETPKPRGVRHPGRTKEGRHRPGPPAAAPAPAAAAAPIAEDVAEDDYWAADQWDPDERVYTGAAAGLHNHLQAVLPKSDLSELEADRKSVV